MTDISPGKPEHQAFLAHLLFSEDPGYDAQRTANVLLKRIGRLEVHQATTRGMSVAALDHVAQFAQGPAPVTLNSAVINQQVTPSDDAIAHLWEFENPEEIFHASPCTILVGDLNAVLRPSIRANLLADYIAAMIEAYPQCTYVYVPDSGALVPAKALTFESGSGSDRFARLIKRRFFRANEDEWLVDTMGMGILGLPDLQYHFHSLDIVDIMDHARIMADYIIENDNPIKDDETTPGYANGNFDMSQAWRMRYERSPIPPHREVIDFNTGSYAAGRR